MVAPLTTDCDSTFSPPSGIAQRLGALKSLFFDDLLSLTFSPKSRQNIMTHIIIGEKKQSVDFELRNISELNVFSHQLIQKVYLLKTSEGPLWGIKKHEGPWEESC